MGSVSCLAQAPPLTNRSRTVRPVEFSVVVPTYNEVENLDDLLARIAAALGDERWEAIIVDDDSPDCTHARARAFAARDARIRVIRRIGRRGLSSACIEGILSSSAQYVAVIDADLQHDPALLVYMLELLRRGQADLVVGSRYAAGSKLGTWSAHRAFISRLATGLTRRITRVALTDPMSGYFAVRRDVFEQTAPRLSGLGFKILLDLVLSADRPLRVLEMPYAFGSRTRGESKLSSSVVWECAMLLADKTVGQHVPLRFITFACTGLFGLALHFLVLSRLYLMVGTRFLAAQTAATCAAVVLNYSINNVVTYSDRSLKGASWWSGLLSFAIVCGCGAVANIGVSNYLFGQQTRWTVAALAGIAVGVVWNYAVSARYTWGHERRAA